jgi:hypothetical protein
MFSKTTKERGESPKKHRGGTNASSKPGGDNSMDAGEFGSPKASNTGPAQPTSPGGSPTRGGSSGDTHITKNQMKSLL